jgi:hypothetical protein
MSATHYLVAGDEYPTPELAWDNSDGEVYCERHADPDTIMEEFWFIPVPDGMSCPDSGELIAGSGWCPGCHEDWADSLRRDHEAYAVARHEEDLERRKRIYGRS